MSFLLVVVGFLAHSRLTRLATTDQITAPLRAKVVARYGPSSAVAYLVHCRWCAGLWLAIPVAAAAALLAGLPYLLLVWPLLTLAYSQATGLLVRAEGDE